MKVNSIGIIGLGTVGNAINHFFSKRNIPVYIYDLHKTPFTNNFKNILKTNIIFISIPSNFISKLGCYDIEPFQKILNKLDTNNFKGAILIKSTLSPGTCEHMSYLFPKLNIIYNPEFLSEKTSIEDFENTKLVILGCTPSLNPKIRDGVGIFFNKIFPNRIDTEIVDSKEAECVKLYLNSFYAVKVQFFNELFFITKNLNISWENITPLMCQQGWLNPQHTRVPGNDGKYSYGGKCLPKDACALLSIMKHHNSYNKILNAAIDENIVIRPENYSI